MTDVEITLTSSTGVLDQELELELDPSYNISDIFNYLQETGLLHQPVENIIVKKDGNIVSPTTRLHMLIGTNKHERVRIALETKGSSTGISRDKTSSVGSALIQIPSMAPVVSNVPQFTDVATIPSTRLPDIPETRFPPPGGLPPPTRGGFLPPPFGAPSQQVSKNSLEQSSLDCEIPQEIEKPSWNNPSPVSPPKPTYRPEPVLNNFMNPTPTPGGLPPPQIGNAGFAPLGSGLPPPLGVNRPENAQVRAPPPTIPRQNQPQQGGVYGLDSSGLSYNRSDRPATSVAQGNPPSPAPSVAPPHIPKVQSPPPSNGDIELYLIVEDPVNIRFEIPVRVNSVSTFNDVKDTVLHHINACQRASERWERDEQINVFWTEKLTARFKKLDRAFTDIPGLIRDGRATFRLEKAYPGGGKA